jgi:predicted nucleic acid-binding protein
MKEHKGELYISDFSINSIGVVAYRLGKLELFGEFLADILPHIHIARLPEYSFSGIIDAIKTHSLDYDDAYQLVAAQEYELEIATQDRDFKKVIGEISVIYL